MQGCNGLMQGCNGLMQGCNGLMQGCNGLMQGCNGLASGPEGPKIHHISAALGLEAATSPRTRQPPTWDFCRDSVVGIEAYRSTLAAAHMAVYRTCGAVGSSQRSAAVAV